MHQVVQAHILQLQDPQSCCSLSNSTIEQNKLLRIVQYVLLAAKSRWAATQESSMA